MASAGIGAKIQEKLLPADMSHLPALEVAMGRAEADAATIVVSGIAESVFEGKITDAQLKSEMAQMVGSALGELVSVNINPPLPPAQPQTKTSQINTQVSNNLDAHPWVRALENDVNSLVNDVKAVVSDIEDFFDPSVTQPNAQPAAQTQQKQSNARAMARYGIHAQKAISASNNNANDGINLSYNSNFSGVDSSQLGPGLELYGTASDGGVSNTPTTQSTTSKILGSLVDITGAIANFTGELANSNMVQGILADSAALQHPSTLTLTQAAGIIGNGVILGITDGSGEGFVAEEPEIESAISNDLSRFKEVFTNATKADARAIIRSGEHDLTPEQADKVLDYLNKGSADRVNLKINNSTGEARLSVERSGKVSGFQRMTYGIDESGATNKVVQTAFDNSGELVRQIPGEPKGNLYDVKRWVK